MYNLNDLRINIYFGPPDRQLLNFSHQFDISNDINFAQIKITYH
jgi:hypothetical protein